MTRLLAALFAVVLTAALILFLPLRTALGLMGADGMGLTAARVTGTIWSGRLEEAGFGGARLGDVAVGLDPFLLLLGRPQLKMEVQGGAVTGRAMLVGGAGGSGLAGAAGTAPLSLAPAGLPIQGAVSVRDLTAVFKAGRCVRASGRVSTDLLQRNAALVGDDGVLLSGEAGCQGGALVVPLQGSSRTAAIVLTLRVEADGRYGLDTRITTSDPALSSRLALAGFVIDGSARRRTDQGRLWR